MRRHEKAGKRAALVVVGILILASHAKAQSVQTDFDRSYDFAKLKTFDFAPRPEGRGDRLAADPLNDRRVRTALDSQLVLHGFTRDPGSPADFLVAYRALTRNRVSVEDYGPRWRTMRYRVDQFTEGTLIVDIVDASSRELVWRGFATGTIEPKDAERKVPKAVKKLVDQFVKDSKRKPS